MREYLCTYGKNKRCLIGAVRLLLCLLFISPSSAERLHKLQISSADILQTFCRYCADILQTVCRTFAQIADQFCRHFADILQIFCRYSADNLSMICRLSADLLQMFHQICSRLKTDLLVSYGIAAKIGKRFKMKRKILMACKKRS